MANDRAACRATEAKGAENRPQGAWRRKLAHRSHVQPVPRRMVIISASALGPPTLPGNTT